MPNDILSNRFRTLVVEDNKAVCDRFCQIISQWDRARLIGACGTLAEALARIEAEEIDILVADLQLPDGSGVDAIRAMARRWPNGHSIVVSALSQRSLVIDALRAGATGYILKDDDRISVIEAVEAILGGSSPISISIARHLVELVRNDGERSSEQSDGSILTARENQILNAIARGFTNREVADIMGISPHTVPVHVRNIYRKLQASNRAEAAYEGRRLGLISY